MSKRDLIEKRRLAIEENARRNLKNFSPRAVECIVAITPVMVDELVEFLKSADPEDKVAVTSMLCTQLYATMMSTIPHNERAEYMIACKRSISATIAQWLKRGE